jgi:hypothetical protein
VTTTFVLTSCSNSENKKTVEKLNNQTKINTDSAELVTLVRKPENAKTVEKSNNQTQTNIDSAKLTTLVRKIYEWHEARYHNPSFPLKYNSPSDSIFIGVDWKAYNRDNEAFKRTNFFSNDFLLKHRAIAMTIDSSIKQASVEWRNGNDGIPLWDTDSDDWCGCQDSPDNYWKRITISNLKFSDNKVVFDWTWDKGDGIDPPFKYEMKAKKVNGIWKISYMEGFKYYGTVIDYQKMMSKNNK